MPISQVTTVQLAAVRALLDHAAAVVAESGPVGATVAMLVADVALETLLKQSLADVAVEVPRHADVHDLTALLTKARPALANAPEAQVARRMRGARNPVQHWGFAPSEATCAAHIRDAKTFANLVTHEVYGIDLLDVSVTSLVRDADLRWALEQAAVRLGEGDVDGACVQAAAAFGLLFARCGSWVRRIIGITETEEKFTGGELHPAVISVFSTEDGFTPNTEHKSWREITLLSLGFSLPELLALKNVELRGEAVLHAMVAGGEPSSPQPSVATVRRVIDVLARQIWRLESADPVLVTGTGNGEPSSAGNQGTIP